MKLQIHGVRHNIHSVSMVNQFLLLAFAGLDGVRVWHHDLRSPWPATDCGFDALDRASIQAIPAPQPGETFDAALSFDHYAVFAKGVNPERCHIFLVTEFGDFTAERQALFRAQMARGVRLVTPSHWAAQRLIESFGDRSADHIDVINHGASEKYYRPLPQAQRDAGRQSLGIAPDEFVFMNLGACTWNKGIDLVLKGFDQVLRSGRRAWLMLKDARGMYGIKADDIIRNMIAQGEISAQCLERILLCSAQLDLSQLGLLYNLADCYVSPYRAEGFNMPALEALACGTPLIATQDGATRDFADASVSFGIEGVPRTLARNQCIGRYTEPSLDHLVSLMQHSFDTDIKRSGHFSSGLADIHRRFGWRAIAQQHLDMWADKPAEQAPSDSRHTAKPLLDCEAVSTA